MQQYILVVLVVIIAAAVNRPRLSLIPKMALVHISSFPNENFRWENFSYISKRVCTALLYTSSSNKKNQKSTRNELKLITP